jgi:hypothetical protein
MSRFLRSSIVAAALLTSQQVEAASITYNFNCIAQGTTCTSSASYGTLTLSDAPGNGDILVTVDLVGSGEKFKDLFLNYAGSAAKITSTNNSGATNLYDPNDVSHAPYQGNFDIGPLGGNDPFAATLYGWTAGGANVNLLLSDFHSLDTLNLVFAALHIQNIGPNGCKAEGPVVCVPGTTGEGSMNSVGATYVNLNQTNQDPIPTPEPAAMVLLGSGLACVLIRHRRKS